MSIGLHNVYVSIVSHRAHALVIALALKANI